MTDWIIRILVEAGLVNYFEDGLIKKYIKKSVEKILKTETGKIVKDMFFLRFFRNPKPGHRMPVQDLEDFIEEQDLYQTVNGA